MNLYEQRLIGGVAGGIIKPSAIPLSGDDFTDLGEVFEVARKIEADGYEIDPAMLASRLEDEFYGADDFKRMAQAAQSNSVVFEAIEHIKGYALKKFLLKEAAEISLNDEASAKHLLARFRLAVEHAEAEYSSVSDDFVSVEEIATEVEAVLTDLRDSVSYSVSTGYATIDELLGEGFTRGDLHVLAGMTGSGKTGLALNFIIKQCKEQNYVGLVSREMSSVQNIIRLLAHESGIARWRMKKGMDSRLYDSLLNHLQNLRQLPLAINVKTTTVQSLRSQVKRLVDVKGMNILYVDYLQLMGSEGRSNRTEEVQSVSRTLKMIAMENNIPVVALSQFNRSAIDTDPDEASSLLFKLKESSGIEQDASTVGVVQLKRPEPGIISEWRDARFTILKNRDGESLRSVDLEYHGATFTFRDLPKLRESDSGIDF